MQHAINWFEIHVTDFDKGVDFYSKVMGYPVQKGDFGGTPHGFFPGDQQNGITGAVVQKNAQLGASTLIYLNAETESNAQGIVGRVEANGGKVLMPLTAIPPYGHMAIFADPEGNKVGIHVSSQG